MFHDNDLYIGRSLNVCGVYSEEEIFLWEQFVHSGWCVIEVGANIGAHTVWLSKAVGSSGKVIAIEAQRHLYNMLCGNVALNSIANIYPMLCAAGASNGMLNVPRIDYAKPGNFGGLSLGGDGDPVPMIALDSLGLEPDFIKIDAEGMEAEILRGASLMIKRCRPVLYVENDRKEKSDELIGLIRDLGYRLYWHRPLVSRDLFGDMVSLNMLCVEADANIAGLNEVEASGCDEEIRRKAMIAAIEHGAVL
jgi:FkbM family methyltransferase